MKAVQPVLSLKQYYAGLRLAERFVIEERRRSTIDERIEQAGLWFGITNRMEAARRAKEESDLRQAWARVFKAWSAR
jgi:hypothetical protein